MAKALCAIVLLLALGAAHVKADVDINVPGLLSKKGFKLASAIYDIAGVGKVAGAAAAKWTALVPTDAAVEAFLKDMSLTIDDLKSRPGLAREIAGVHLILRHNVRKQELFAEGPVRIVKSAAGTNNNLLFKEAEGKVTVIARQGVVANVQPEIIKVDDFKTIHVVDAVLYGDGYFTSFDELCELRGLTIYDFCEAATYAGLWDTLNADFDHTMFLPNNEAFVASKLNLGAGSVPAPAKVADILKYHVLAGPAKETPKGIAAGSHATLLDGESVTISYARAMQGGIPVAEASVNGVKVVKANVYVGKAIVNGIDAVLKPGAVSTTAAPSAAAASSEGAITLITPKGVITLTPPKLSLTLPTLSIKKADLPKLPELPSKPQAPSKAAISVPSKPEILSKPAAASASVSVSATAGKGNRKLLDFGWGAEAGATASEDDAADAIQNAVDGNISADQAAQQSLLGAEELSVPGDYQQVDEGINPW